VTGLFVNAGRKFPIVLGENPYGQPIGLSARVRHFFGAASYLPARRAAPTDPNF
jgi:hypothetical protein